MPKEVYLEVQDGDNQSGFVHSPVVGGVQAWSHNCDCKKKKEEEKPKAGNVLPLFGGIYSQPDPEPFRNFFMDFSQLPNFPTRRLSVSPDAPIIPPFIPASPGCAPSQLLRRQASIPRLRWTTVRYG
ncbi:hypothetical protein BX616_005337 [Lobosporangium transversale]|nr:hypothetical protein BX616_005337 [Lobosporangium transversale]